MKNTVFILLLLLSALGIGQSTDQENAVQVEQQVILNSAKPVYAPEFSGIYQWNYENPSQTIGSLDGMYNQFFLLNNSLKSQGQNQTQLQNNPDLISIVTNSSIDFPNTFESNFMQYVHEGENTVNGEYLLKAYSIDPNRPEILDEVLEYSEWTGNQALSLEIAEKIKTNDKYDPAIYDYANRLMESIPENSYLITSGELETISGKVLQLVEGKHKSVTIIQKDWLETGKYSPQRLSELGLNSSGFNQDTQSNIQNLILSNPGKSFFISLTLPIQDFNNMLDRLYLIGLSYQYHDSSYDNMNELVSNWERHYMLLPVSAYNASDWGRKIASNYLVSGFKLYQYYRDTGNNRKANKLKNKLTEIARICNQEDQVNAMY